MIRIIQHRGFVNLLMAGVLCGLLAAIALGDGLFSIIRKETVTNIKDSSKAESNVMDAIHQFKAFVETKNLKNFNEITAHFAQSDCSNPSVKAPGTQAITGWAPVVTSDRDEDRLEVFASIGSSASPCVPASSEDWKIYFRAVGRYDCGSGPQDPKWETCARKEYYGSLGMSERKEENSVCDPPTICVPETYSCPVPGTSTTTTTFEECGVSAYEWKTFNNTWGSGFAFGGLWEQNGGWSNDPDIIEKVWKAPVTVLGDIVNANDPDKMFSEGMVTSLGVSFADNVMYYGNTLPPLTYFQPVEIGGQVIPRRTTATSNSNPTTGVNLRVWGATIRDNGRLASGNRVVETRIDTAKSHANLLGPDPTLAGTNTNYQPPQAGHELNLSALPNLRNQRFAQLYPDRQRSLRWFIGRDTNETRDSSRLNLGGNDLQNLFPIRQAQMNFTSIVNNWQNSNYANPLTGGGDMEPFSKMPVAYYYFNPRGNQRAVKRLYDKGTGTFQNKTVAYDHGVAYYLDDGLTGDVTSASAPKQRLALSEAVLKSRLRTCDRYMGEAGEVGPTYAPYGNAANWHFFEQDIVNEPDLWGTGTVNTYSVYSGNHELPCYDPVRAANPARYEQYNQARRDFNNRVNSFNTTITNANSQRSRYDTYQVYLNNLSAARNNLANERTEYDNAVTAGDVADQQYHQQRIQIFEQQVRDLENNPPMTQADSDAARANALDLYRQAITQWQQADAQWRAFVNSYRPDFTAALNDRQFLVYKTQAELVGKRRLDLINGVDQAPSGHWIQDYLNNPIRIANENNQGACVSGNQRPCTPEFGALEGPQSQLDSAVIVIDASGTDGVYLSNIRYPSAQLIVVYGNLYAEDVILNANLLVIGDLYLMGRGMSVAPRKWWGLPRPRNCRANLNIARDGGSTTAISQNTVFGTEGNQEINNSVGFNRYFYPYFQKAVKVKDCRSTTTTSGTPGLPSTCTRPCPPVEPPLCSATSITSAASLRLSLEQPQTSR